MPIKLSIELTEGQMVVLSATLLSYGWMILWLMEVVLWKVDVVLGEYVGEF